MNCFKLSNKECWTFIICATLSLITTGFAFYLLIADHFKTVAITSFATGIITGNIAFWTNPPKIKQQDGQLPARL